MGMTLLKDTINRDSYNTDKVRPAVIKVIGVGGGGGNAVNRMISQGLKGVDFIVANTDLQDVRSSLATHRIQLGAKCTRGLGAGAKPDTGREAALEDLDMIREYLADADMVFVTAGMGGGTGTGAAPVIAGLAKEMGCLTVGVVTRPFTFEGKVRRRNGDHGINELRNHVDTLIVIPNDNLLGLANKNTTIIEAFTMADDVLRVAVQGISDLINTDGLINLDFADVRTVLSGMGQAIMGIGEATGEGRALKAAQKAIQSPLLDNVNINGAKGVLVNVTGSRSMTLHEAYEAASFIEEHADEDANIIFGACIDESLEDRVEITVIAAGFGEGSPVRAGKDARHVEPETVRGRPTLTSYPGGRAAAPAQPTPSFAQPVAAVVRPKPVVMEELFPPTHEELRPMAGKVTPTEEEDYIFELDEPMMEPIETLPRVPGYTSGYPNSPAGHDLQDGSDLDVPAFIRRGPSRFPKD